MLTSTSDIINKLNFAKTLYSKFDKDAEEKLSESLIREAFAEVYHRGDRVLSAFVALHFLLAVVFAPLYNTWGALWTGLAAVVIFYASVFFSPRTFFTRALAGVVLQTFGLLYIHQMHGLSEARFFFLTSFTILIVYQDWKALWPSALLLFGQMFVFIYLSSYVDSIPFITSDYRAFILRVVPRNADRIDYEGLGFYVGISCLQVALSGIWARFLRHQTINEVLSKQSLLTKQLEVENANEKLEENVRNKTRELQEALEVTQANEEELRQNMEELQTTQEEMNKQRQQLLDNQSHMEEVEKELRERQKKMERSQWMESNLSRFDELMRLHYDKKTEVFSEMIMLNLAELLQATQGAFYIYFEEDKELRMTGGYACTPETAKKAIFREGEGILGQVVKSRKLVHLDNIPDDGPVIESALTKVQSKSLVIIPLLYNEEVQGVIELAALGKIDTLHLEFLERLSKNIASMLQSIRGIHRTQKLLIQSQEMTAKLQDNAREIEKTRQEAEHRALEFQSQFKAIDRSMLVLELSPQGDILRANENFLKLSKYKGRELLGKHHSIFLTENYINSGEFGRIWSLIRNDEFVEAEYECVAKDGSSFWMKANYYSLGFGKLKKVMVLAFDTTLEKKQDEKIIQNLEMLREKEEMMEKNMTLMKNLQREVEKKAKELEEQMNAINTSTALIEYDPQGVITYINDKFLSITGYREKELLGRSHRVLVGRRLADSQSYQAIWEKLKSNNFVEGEFEFLAKAGHTIWLRGSYYPVSDERGRLIKVLQLASNITIEIDQEKQIKDYLLKLEKTHTRLQEQIRSLEAELGAIRKVTGVVELDPEGHILNANPVFLSLMRYNNGDLIGKHHRILMPKEYAKSPAYRSFLNNLKKNKTVEGEFINITKDKTPVKVKASYSPVFNEQNQIAKVIGLVSEVKEVNV